MATLQIQQKFNFWSINLGVAGSTDILYFAVLNQVEVKFVWQISYPPVNGSS